MKNTAVKIALIDSGIDTIRKELSNTQISHVDLGIFDDYYSDSIGHGTAIAYLFTKLTPQSIIYSFKIFNKYFETKEELLIMALEYIYTNMSYINIIHISSGIVNCESRDILHDLCKKLVARGIIIVSSYANFGVVSYPASFPEVIGVFWDYRSRNVNDYIYVENSCVNILGYAGAQRLPWVNDTYKKVSGSSFISPYITSMIANNYIRKSLTSENVKTFLSLKARDKLTFKASTSISIQEQLKLEVMSIKKAIIFPINKETHALLGNTDLLDFKIIGVYDLPLLGNINKDVSDLVHGPYPLKQKIKTYTDIDWDEDFDTVILGHTKKINNIVKIDFIIYFLNLCILHHKNLYCFDLILDYAEKIVKLKNQGNFISNFCIKDTDIINRTFGGLYSNSTPIIGVFGTSPQQGKFNIQLELRRRFIYNQYNIGQLGTEPSSALFNMDITYPCGYESSVFLSTQKEITYVNEELSNLHNKDIIIVGSQSQTIPLSFGNLAFYTTIQHNLLLASEPDAVILAINVSDKYEYIRNTINYLNEYMQSNVIALVLFPFEKSYEWNIMGDNIRVNNESELTIVVEELIKLFELPVFVNGNLLDMDKLFQCCIDFFSD